MPDVVNPRYRDIYIALVDPLEYWTTDNALTYARRDLDIMDATISKEDENSFWTAEVKVRNRVDTFYSKTSKKRVIISERDQLTGSYHHVITGRMEGTPVGDIGAATTFNVHAQAPTTTSINVNTTDVKREYLEDLALTGLDDDPYQLFNRTPIGVRRKPEERLGARYAKLNWPRDDFNEPTLTDLQYGDGHLDLGGQFIEGSCKITKPDGQPIVRVPVVLTAEWEPSRLSILDVGSTLDGFGVTFEPGFFGTASSQLSTEMLRLGAKIGEWTVIQNVLNQASPQQVGVDGVSGTFNVKTTVTPSMNAAVNAQNGYAQIVVPRFFWSLDLKVAGVVTARVKEVVSFYVDWNGQNVAGYEGASEQPLELSVSNLQSYVQYPGWLQNHAYSQNQKIQVDGMKWQSINDHNSGAGNFYDDVGNWAPVLIDLNDPTGGPYMDYFFGQPEDLIVNNYGGGQQIIFRSPTPGMSAINYAFNQAYGKLLNGLRRTTSFVAPWWLVRDLEGKETITITDPGLPGGTITGKVVSIKCSLIDQKASITIASLPGEGFLPQVPVRPQYNSPGMPSGGVLNVSLQNEFRQFEAMLAQELANDPETNVSTVSRENQATLQVDLTPLPKGINIEIPIIDMGVILVDCSKQITVEADG